MQFIHKLFIANFFVLRCGSHELYVREKNAGVLIVLRRVYNNTFLQM